MDRFLNVEPMLPLPILTDIAQCMVKYPRGPCTPLEIKMLNCLEAYGQRIGETKCADLMADFKECTEKNIQRLRVNAMVAERKRQYKAGERQKQYADTPPLDLF